MDSASLGKPVNEVFGWKLQMINSKASLTWKICCVEDGKGGGEGVLVVELTIPIIGLK